jgi:anti-sigma factor RsiW
MKIMDCGLDLKAFSLGEATPAERKGVESHVKSCEACREELSRLELTFASLGALREEEVPKRIAFVSDKVFEPTWWQRIWNSGPQLGFASASMLAAALVFHAVAVRPPAAPAVQQVAATVTPQATVNEEQIQQRIDQAVAKAVAVVEERQQKRTAELLQAAEKRSDMDRQGLLVAFEEQNKILLNRVNMFQKVSAGLQ